MIPKFNTRMMKVNLNSNKKTKTALRFKALQNMVGYFDESERIRLIGDRLHTDFKFIHSPSLKEVFSLVENLPKSHLFLEFIKQEGERELGKKPSSDDLIYAVGRLPSDIRKEVTSVLTKYVTDNVTFNSRIDWNIAELSDHSAWTAFILLTSPRTGQDPLPLKIEISCPVPLNWREIAEAIIWPEHIIEIFLIPNGIDYIFKEEPSHFGRSIIFEISDIFTLF